MKVRDIVQAWSTLGVDIPVGDLPHSQISLTQCELCRLEMWQPAWTGDGDFYAQLSRQPWYYLTSKWEYEVALSDIKPGERVLEVGCGHGAFLRLLARRGVQAIGVETSRKAVAQARNAGLDVRHCPVEKLVPSEAGKYDVVCHFQVLEHVADPLNFLTNCVDLLKPGGRLLIATPNQDSFVRHAPGSLLNMPPHHQSRWAAQTYYSVANALRLKLLRIEHEPLAAIHAGWAAQCWANTFLGVGIDDPVFVSRKPSFGSRLCFKLADSAGQLMLRWKTLRTQFRGHSIYVAFAQL